MPLSKSTFPESSENGRILEPAFWCWRTTFELILGIAERPSISSATCSRRTPKCSQLILVLNTYSLQTIKLKLAAFLPSAAPTGRPLVVHTFLKGFSVSKMVREIEQKPGEDVVWQRFSQTRQDTVVEVFPIQLRAPLAGCAGFFLQVSIPRRILTKMSGAIYCMNMRFAKRS